MTKHIRLSESLEDYLEVILGLEKTKKVARAKDIAERMGVQRGSVTSALKSLKEKGLINYEPYSFVTLTEMGKRIAEEITLSHNELKHLLLNVLKIDEETAEATACRMEHAIDKKSLDRLLSFFDFVYKCPRAGEEWMRSFASYCSSGKPGWEICGQCIEKCKTAHQLELENS
ncbi:MAG: metal-dependent transcriptional regulator [Deltaproteobacteria bacterium]|nr:metal-dependent transcriptional regulator [Deltaproteobacteria bacterium]MBW2143839.1 metal-dependent transcriptional regulator [Deltaproteobacteria bacterium]